MKNSSFSFLNFLNQNGLYYKTNILEEFLLTLKIDNIIFFNGSSGIGKTSLAKYYAKYYILKTEQNRKIESSSKIGKTKTSKGFAVKRQNISTIVPHIKYEDECYFVVDDITVKGRLNIQPRLFFNPNDNSEFINYLDQAIEEGKEQFNYYILLDEPLNSNYVIINAKDNDKNNENVLSIIEEASINPHIKYFLIFDSVRDNNISNILFKRYEIPSNLIIIYTGLIQNLSKYSNNFSIINFESLSPLDYLQNNVENVYLNNTGYLEEFEYEYIENINTIKSQLRNIKIDSKKELYNLLLDQLNNLYYILKEDNIDLSNEIINKILNYMIIAYKYEDKPEIFSNWEKYVDLQICQRIIPLLENEDGVSIDTIEKLIDYCNNEYNYNRSYTILNNM